MADDKSGRDDQADDAERRQREREIRTELERGDEPEPPVDETEPPVDETELASFEAGLDPVAFPATGAEVVATVGDREIDSLDGTDVVADLLADADTERFDTPAAVRARVQRPDVAAAMKRIVEASEPLQDEELTRSQREASERTLRALAAIDGVDDEVVRAVGDWIVDRIRDDGEIPGSRVVRKLAAAVCRERGYEVRDDEWLGA